MNVWDIPAGLTHPTVQFPIYPQGVTWSIRKMFQNEPSSCKEKIETKKHAASRSLTTYVKAIVVKGGLARWSGGPLPLLIRDITRTLSLTRNRVLSRPIYWIPFGGDFSRPTTSGTEFSVMFLHRGYNPASVLCGPAA